LAGNSRRRESVVKLRMKFGISERRARKALDQPRSSQRFKARQRSDEAPSVKRMLLLARSPPRLGGLNDATATANCPMRHALP
jgi:hypothetical protein